MSGAHSREHDRIYLVSSGIEWNFTILSNACGVSHDSFISISEGQCCGKSSTICSGLYLGEGIAVGGAQHDLGRSLAYVCEYFSRPIYLPMLMEMFRFPHFVSGG
jgi:hypothetical protein